MTDERIFADDADLDEPLRTAVNAVRAEAIPVDAIGRIQGRARQLGRTASYKRRGRTARVMRYASIAAAIAVSAVVTIWAVGLTGRQAAWAEVVAAVEERPWIRVTKGDRVVWYSPQKDISAWRDENWVEYHDHAVRVYYSYDVDEKILYRVPEFTPGRRNRYAVFTAALQALLRQEQLPREPLDQMKFPESEGSEMRVVDQSLERKEEDGKAWLEYRLSLIHREQPKMMLLEFRVDPETKLPRSYRLEGEWNERQFVDEAQLSYPEEGPADVYYLGVPTTAPIVDRVPKDDVQRIVDTHRAGRQRMGNYRALLVSRTTSTDYAWWNNTRPMIMYRKGDKFRLDNAGWRQGGFPFTEKPAEDADMEAWWKQRADDFVYSPFYITRGFSTYHIEKRAAKNAAGENSWIVDSVDERIVNTVPGEMYPDYWSRRPEFVCRPPMGIGRQDLEVTLEDAPEEDGAKLVRLGVKRTGRLPQAPGGPVPPDSYEHWLDPARGYAAVRWESAGTRFVIEEMARSPGGVWYATRFRHIATGPNDELIEELFDVYVDFEADLPDSLFEVPEVGQTY